MDIPLREKALAFATKYHHGQKRKDGKDYITHPIAVAEIAQRIYREHVLMFDADEDFLDEVYIIALLHDVVEDTNATLNDIELEFGYYIASCVDLLSKKDGQNYYDFIMRLVKKQDFIPIFVKLADLEHNTSDLNEGSLKDKYRLAAFILREVLD